MNTKPFLFPLTGRGFTKGLTFRQAMCCARACALGCFVKPRPVAARPGCVSRAGSRSNEKALKKWGIRSTHFHKPMKLNRSTNVQVTDKAPISFNAVLPEVASTNADTKNETFFSFLFFKEGKFLEN
jgi:hypothetical protein